ncbi:MAG: indolepyruvate ferredoxin oxidoreductase family protein [Azospirillum sp.]|nr:indolepyruvate ferredoxin oxidoreductase family protein [Azospirillum sp.]
MALAAIRLDDKYALESGRVFMTGTQALVRLPMMQRRRDLARGLNTACFISGYRGSPMGGLDQALWQARPFLDRHHIRFQPGVNEELAATSIWGSQQVGLFPGATYDGVFAMWYGKGPGVDRSGDVFKHANFAGSSRHGGVLVLAGDDHACKSSTVPHQSEHAFMHAMIPVINPSGVQEILETGMLGWAMSRYSGCWIAMKTIAETMDSSASVSIDPERFHYVLPEGVVLPPGGLNIRWPDPPLEQEERLMRSKLYAALAFARANQLDRVVIASPRPRFGIITAGKSYLDVRQALDELEISETRAAELGLTVYKVMMTWPLERDGARHFAEGLEEILVVEEKRAVIENQLKEQLYNWHAEVRPRVIGKFDETGAWILPSTGELSPAQIAVVIGRRLLRFQEDARIAERVAFLEARETEKAHPLRVARRPSYCPGCPHNTSTVVPEGSRALGGIGCHYMATWMDRRTETFSQMGGEGAAWIGQAAFTETPHVFANLGDGTYFHSGSLAIRAAIAAGVNITYKLLYNDAVAMTGGQPLDGSLTVAQLTRQLAAEGIARIALVSDQPEQFGPDSGLAPFTTIDHRDDLEQVQRALREVRGVSALVYVQTCAAEKRRRRKRGRMVDPPQRVIINEQVCEGCGDCSKKSNCLSVVPVDTEFGRKRRIDQSSCNKDFSCIKGFCPSFVTVLGGALRKPRAAEPLAAGTEDLAEPALPTLERPYGIYVTGVGGTGVVTIGALLGMAAHLEGKGCAVLDMTGLAQKGGAVTSHIRIAATPDDIHAVRVAAGGARVVLGCDLVVAAQGDALSKMAPGRTRAVINRFETITAEFTRNADFRIPGDLLLEDIRAACGRDGVTALDATRLATALLGDSIAANLFMLGVAWQQGLIPLSRQAILRAIEINGAAVRLNTEAFQWGRRAADNLAAVEAAAAKAIPIDTTALPHRQPSRTLDEAIDRRVQVLTAYQDAAYADRYRAVVERVRRAEAALAPGRSGLAEAVVRYAFKLMAYKDEYEVARLYSDGAFQAQLAESFEGDYRLEVHLAPPLLARPDPVTGEPRKVTFGPWVFRLFGPLARLKGLRGSWLDPFGYTAERRQERRLIEDYQATVETLVAGLTPDNHRLAVEIASLPEQIRGFGPVKQRHLAAVSAQEKALLDAFDHPERRPLAAE